MMYYAYFRIKELHRLTEHSQTWAFNIEKNYLYEVACPHRARNGWPSNFFNLTVSAKEAYSFTYNTIKCKL